MSVIVLIAGIWLVFWALVMRATGENYLLSALVFKVIPFFLGLGCLFSGAKETGK